MWTYNFKVHCICITNFDDFSFIPVCHKLAEYLENYKKDYEKASKVFRSTCDDYGYAKSCLKYGHYNFLGRGKSGSKPSAPDALNYYQKGCDLKNSESCLHAGLLLMSKDMKQRNIEQDFPKVSSPFSAYIKWHNGI